MSTRSTKTAARQATHLVTDRHGAPLRVSVPGAASAAPDCKAPPRGLLEAIARRDLQIPTLRERGLDRLDFHDLHVKPLRNALLTAFLAGAEVGMKLARSRKS